MTGVTWTAPTSIRGIDTPSGDGPGTPRYMPDRISTGRQNWGSFTDNLVITPALLGISAVNVSITSPGGSQYGTAAVDNNDVARANLVGKSILHVDGSAFTQPDATGMPTNASQLRLHTSLRSGSTDSSGFSVANIPIAVIARTIAVFNAEQYQNLSNNSYAIAPYFQMIMVQDGNASDPSLMYTEYFKLTFGSDYGLSTSNGSFSPTFTDLNGLFADSSAYPNVDAFQAYYRSKPKLTSQTTPAFDSNYIQIMKYYNKAVQSPPQVTPGNNADLSGVNNVEFSGYNINMGPLWWDTVVVDPNIVQRFFFQVQRAAQDFGPSAGKGMVTDINFNFYESIYYLMNFSNLS